MPRQHHLGCCLPNAKTLCLGEMDRAPRHLGFEADQLARRVPGRRPRTRGEVYSLGLQADRLRALQDPCQEVLKRAGIVDIAMQHLGDVALIEDTLLTADDVEHDLRATLDPAGTLGPALFEDLQPIERFLPALVADLAVDGLGRDTDMRGRHHVDAALGIGAAIDADIEAASAR